MRRTRLVVDCDEVAIPTLDDVDCLCRLRLEAHRAGFEIELRNVRPSLVELLNFAGLAALLLEGEGQPEQREQASGVEEEGEFGDPPVL